MTEATAADDRNTRPWAACSTSSSGSGNKVPHPVMMFLYLIIGVIVLSAVLGVRGRPSPTRWSSRTRSRPRPATTRTRPSRSSNRTPYARLPRWLPHRRGHDPDQEPPLDRGDPVHLHVLRPELRGLRRDRRHVRRADGRGRRGGKRPDGALIRLLVAASPRRLLAFTLIFVGVLSSVASDAGYLILVPLGAAAFASVGRHPLAGMAACFAGVGAIFGVNPIPARSTPRSPRSRTRPSPPSAADAAHDPRRTTGSASSRRSCSRSSPTSSPSGSSSRVSERGSRPADSGPDGIAIETEEDAVDDPAAEKRGLRCALIGFLVFLGFVLLITLPARRAAPRSGDRRHHRRRPRSWTACCSSSR